MAPSRDRNPPLKGHGALSNPAGRFERHQRETVDDGWYREETPELVPTSIEPDRARSVIARNDSPDIPFEQSINPYRGCSHACPYCLGGDTPILMGDGSARPIAKVTVGSEIYGTARQGSLRRYVKTRVLDHWSVIKPAYRVVLEDATEIVAGADHRFLTDRGWKFVISAMGGGLQRPYLTEDHKLIGTGKFAEGMQQDIEGDAVKSEAPLRVKSVEPVGTMRLYDITTGTGDFIANGVISHNCYARPSHAYVGLSAGLDFETRLFYKRDAGLVLEEELAKPGYVCKPITLGANTDPYQPIERRMRVTREILEVLARCRHPVTIITKSALVLRDLDLLAAMAKDGLAGVGVSITTLDVELKRVMEPQAASPRARLETVRRLNDAGIPTGVMVAPVIPALTDHEMEAILESAAAAGARWAGYVLLRLPFEVKDVFREWLAAHRPDRAEHVMSLVRQMRGGKDYDSSFGRRMCGSGPLAELLRSRFQVACRRLGLGSGRHQPADTGLFRPPPPKREGPQLVLDL